MNILVDELPNSVEIDGVKYEINSDFRNGINLYRLINDKTLEQNEIYEIMLIMYYGNNIPRNTEEAIRKIIWFYGCGNTEEEQNSKNKKNKIIKRYTSGEKQIDYEQDSNLIFSAFISQYGINLNHIEFLHWWEFQALLQGLNNDCKLSEVIKYRSKKLDGLKGEEKKFYSDMKKLYEIKEELSQEEKDLLKEYEKEWG